MVAQITPLSDPPSRSDPENFVERSDQFMSELPVFAIEANALAVEVNALASSATTTSGAAALSANDAASSASEAETSKNAAALSASNALTSEVSAETSAIQASKLNLGGKSAPPALDNRGEPLQVGATYYDTTLNKWRVYSGTAWVDGISAIAGVSTVNGKSGAVTIPLLPDFVLMNLGVI